MKPLSGGGADTKRYTYGQTTSYTWDVAAGLPVVLQDGTNSYVYGVGLISATDSAGVQTYFMADGLGSRLRDGLVACRESGLCRTIVVEVGVAGCAAFTVGIGTLGCAAAGAVALSYEDAIDCARGSTGGCVNAAIIIGISAVPIGGKALPRPVGALVRTGKSFNADQDALIQLAKASRRPGVTRGEADTLLRWAKEYGVRARDDTALPWHWRGGGHIHIGPIRHIPVR